MLEIRGVSTKSGRFWARVAIFEIQLSLIHLIQKYALQFTHTTAELLQVGPSALNSH